MEMITVRPGSWQNGVSKVAGHDLGEGDGLPLTDFSSLGISYSRSRDCETALCRVQLAKEQDSEVVG